MSDFIFSKDDFMDVVSNPYQVHPGYQSDFKFSLEAHKTTKAFRELNLEEV